jgi:hypothetical protein
MTTTAPSLTEVPPVAHSWLRQAARDIRTADLIAVCLDNDLLIERLTNTVDRGIHERTVTDLTDIATRYQRNAAWLSKALDAERRKKAS